MLLYEAILELDEERIIAGVGYNARKDFLYSIYMKLQGLFPDATIWWGPNPCELKYEFRVASKSFTKNSRLILEKSGTIRFEDNGIARAAAILRRTYGTDKV